MLSVLLKIFAVLGIILLILLGIILFLLLIALFVPITYRITGQIDENKKGASVKVCWLFGILRFTLEYSEKLSWKLKLLWLDITGKLNKPKEPATAKKESVSPVEATSETCGDSSLSDEEAPLSDEKPPLASEVQSEDEEPSSTEDVMQKKSLAEKINDLNLKIQSIFAKIKDIWSNVSYYIGILREDDTKDLFSHSFKVVGSILKSIRPRKLKINVVLGFDSPDTTGKIYGLLCMLYPYYGDDIHITPDFENKILEGTLFSKGRISIWVLVWNALRILLDRKLFKVIHKFKNGGKGKNGR